MCDERSQKGIKIYKNITVIMFWLYIAAGVAMFFMGLDGFFWWIDGGFLDGIICLAAGVIVGYINLVVNMLVIQFLNNVQIIREKIENKE